MLSNLGKGSRFPGYRTYIVEDDFDNKYFTLLAADKDHAMGSARKVAYGGGSCTTGSTTDCASGACAGSVCLCDPLSYGEKCESSLKDLGVVTVVCTTDSPAHVVTSVPATWALLQANGGAGVCTTGATSGNVKIFIDEYDRTKDGFTDLPKINVVVLAGVYLILSMVMVAYAMFAGFFDGVLGYSAILDLLHLDASGDRPGLVRKITIAVTTSLMDVLAVIALTSGIWLLSGATPSGHLYVNADLEVVDSDVFMIPFGILASLCTLTVVSRITRAIDDDGSDDGGEPSRGAKFTTLVCSTMIIVIVCNAYLERAHLDQLLCSGLFATIIAFELVYVAQRLMNMRSDAALVGIKAFVVVCVLYLSARRAANFRSRFNAAALVDSDQSARDTIEGSPQYQLGYKGDMCHFLYTDMLKPDTEASSISDQWHPYRNLGGGAAVTDGKQWFCKGDSGTSGNALRLIIALPLVFYLVAAYAGMGTGALSNLQTSVKRFVGDMSLSMRQRGLARAQTAGERRQYTRIRVGQGP